MTHERDISEGMDANCETGIPRFQLTESALAEVEKVVCNWDCLPDPITDTSSLEHLDVELSELVDEVRDARGYGILTIPSRDLELLEAVTWLISWVLGRPMAQNSEGLKLVHVFDRDSRRSMNDGARYHQTHQGGSIHTDNVNLADEWQYMVLSCRANAVLGGESIFVDGNAIIAALQAYAPEALPILTNRFWFDSRGFTRAPYQAPIIGAYSDGNAHFRYLRDYIEAGHQLAKSPLSTEQRWALDALDSALEDSRFQQRVRLSPGDVVIALDGRILHGRTSFIDCREGSPRKMYRVWVQDRQPQ